MFPTSFHSFSWRMDIRNQWGRNQTWYNKPKLEKESRTTEWTREVTVLYIASSKTWKHEPGSQILFDSFIYIYAIYCDSIHPCNSVIPLSSLNLFSTTSSSVVYHRRQWHALPGQQLRVNRSSGKSRFSWMPPLTMREHQRVQSCAGAHWMCVLML